MTGHNSYPNSDGTFLDTDDSLMSPEEETEQEERLRMSEELFKDCLKHHVTWKESMMKRRMMALSRIKTLQRSQWKRYTFYEDVRAMLDIGENDIHTLSSTNSDASSVTDKLEKSLTETVEA